MNDASPASAGPLVKRTLVTLSHAMERAALAPGDGPLVVMALFQRLPYFERESEMYSRLAVLAEVTVVGFVDDFRPQLPGRIHPVLLNVDEPLALEWTVVVATPRMGAFLVAVDQETAVTGERTLESGRLFDSRWGFSAVGAHAELRRLRDQVATRLPPGALAVIDEVVLGADEASPAEEGVTASMRLLVNEAERTRRASVALRDQLESVTVSENRDLTTRLYTPAFLHRWAGAVRTTTAGPLPLALLLITVPRLAGIGRYGARTERETVAEVAAALTRRLRSVDRAVRLADNEFLLVVPGITEDGAAELVQHVTTDLHRLGDVYPFLPMDSVSAITVTRKRPLPIEDLRSTVAWATSKNVPVALLPA